MSSEVESLKAEIERLKRCVCSCLRTEPPTTERTQSIHGAHHGPIHAGSCKWYWANRRLVMEAHQLKEAAAKIGACNE